MTATIHLIRGPITEIATTAPEFMRQRPSVLFYPVLKKMNGKGLCPIYCRITFIGARAEFSTGITVRAGDFSRGSLIETAPGFATKNNELLFIENRLQEIHLHLRINKKPVTADKIKKIYLEPPQAVLPFFDLIKKYVNEKTKRITNKNTLSAHKVRLSNLEMFFQDKDLLKAAPADITSETMSDFQDWMLDRNCGYSHINKHLYLLAKVILKAIGKGLLTQNVLSGYEYSHDPDKEIIALTKEELILLENKKFVSQRLQHVADLYVFCCYTSFAYCDMTGFDYEKDTSVIDGKRWIIRVRQKNLTKKTRIEQITPVLKKAEEILLKYNYNLPAISNQKYNDYIKEVAEILGIEKELTTHTARKTFAMMRIEEGFTFDSTAKMMGHKSSKQTENTYGKVTHKRIALEMKNKKTDRINKAA